MSEETQVEAPLLSLDDIIVQEIFTLHDFRDWWRAMTGARPAQFRYKMTRAEWEAAVRAFKKLKGQK